MTKLSKNSELQQSCITAVKSRFFAQYWGQDVCQTKGGRYKLDEDCFPLWEKSYLELKLLSKITDEDAQEIQIITGANHLPKQPLIYACLKKSDAIPVIDFLRSKGYAIPFMGYSVEDLVSFGWVQLL